LDVHFVGAVYELPRSLDKVLYVESGFFAVDVRVYRLGPVLAKSSRYFNSGFAAF